VPQPIINPSMDAAREYEGQYMAFTSHEPFPSAGIKTMKVSTKNSSTWQHLSLHICCHPKSLSRVTEGKQVPRNAGGQINVTRAALNHRHPVYSALLPHPIIDPGMDSSKRAAQAANI